MSAVFLSGGTQPQWPRYVIYFSLKKSALNIGKVQTRYLCLTAAQRQTIENLCDQGCATEYQFDASNQAAAHDFLTQHGLDQVSRNSLDSHWNTQWSSGWSVQDGEDYRTLSMVHSLLFACRS